MSRPKGFPYTLDVSQIPTIKLRYVRDGHIAYQAPDFVWGEHLETWRKLRQNGKQRIEAPEPMPYGHLMFERPHSYGYVVLGDESEKSRRAAWEHCIRSDLSGGWCEPGPELERIVKATVEAKMDGVEVGASHFLAAVGTWL